MITAILARGFSLTQALRGHVMRRLHAVLRRHDGRVERVDVRLSDINGPRGGADKECLLRLRLAGRPDVVVRTRDADAYAAIDRSAARIERAVTQQLARARRRALR